jgi:UDP-N-acetylmuramate dehydrogenase
MNEACLINKFDLTRYNTMRLKVVAESVIIPYSTIGLVEAVKENKNKKIVILGNASNIIFLKEYYDESYVFILTNMINKMHYENGIFYAESGVLLEDLAWFALEKSISRYEFLEDIPGTLGGGVFMNAGTYEQCIGNLINNITWYNPNLDKIITTENNGNLFAKRESIFSHNGGIILSCEFKYFSGNYEEILNNMLEIKKKRYLKQPRNYPSSGSVFKRPRKNGQDLYIWKLFDELGLRGYSIGGALISDKHPGFIVNNGNCKGTDILKLIELCKSMVKEKYDIDLELELRLI